MRQESIDAVKLIKYIYGLENYDLPENIKTKAFIFYTTDEEKSVLETNHIFYLEPDCSKEDVIDVFENKIKTEKFIGLHAVDFKLALVLDSFSIYSILIQVNPNTEKLFKIAELNLNTNMFTMSQFENDKLNQLVVIKLIKYKSIALGDKVFLASINKDFNMTDENIKTIVETKYNTENIFNEENKQISQMVENYARSRH